MIYIVCIYDGIEECDLRNCLLLNDSAPYYILSGWVTFASLGPISGSRRSHFVSMSLQTNDQALENPFQDGKTS